LGQTNKIIEVNGKRYDAITGALITGNRLAAKSAAAIHAAPHVAGPRSIDGFARVSRDHAPTPAIHKPVAAPSLVASHHKPHTPAHHTAPHQQQHATTLMRTAVKKPHVQSVAVIKSQTRTDILAHKPAQTVAPKISFGSIDRFRTQRAAQMIKSNAVSHFRQPVFNTAAFSRPVAKLQPAQVAAAPSIAIAAPKPVGALDFIATGSGHTKTKIQHSAPTQSRASDIFEQALAGATSHEQTFEALRAPRTRKKRGRALAIIATSFAALLLIGFLGFQNSSQLSLKVASYRSGINAKLPSYQPSDYSFNHLNYTPGNVVASYSSTSGDQEYNISQKESNWDSQALLSNVVATAKASYKTYQRAGRTVYVLSNNTATWVDSGILYTVDGNASLTSNQLLELASSM